MTEEVEKKAVKKGGKKKINDVIKNAIELNPTLKEQSGKTVVLGWGRMNPVTVGHEKLANKIKSVAKENNATAMIYLTHSQDPKKNPLKYDDKVSLAQTAFGRDVVKKSKAKTIIQAMQEIDGQYDNVIIVVGQDRVAEFDKLLQKYNGKDYTFDSVKIVSAGDRDPDAEGVEGMSASKMRAAAASGKKDDFVSGLPKKLKRQGDKVYDMVRTGMGINEEVDLDEKLKASDDMSVWVKDFQDSDAPQFKGKSQKKRQQMAVAAKLDAEEQNEEVEIDEDRAPLTITQRRNLAMSMRRNKAKIAMGRKRAANRKPTPEKLKIRAEKRARDIIRKKVIGQSGKSYDDLAVSQKAVIDKKVAKRKAAIKRLAKKLIPKMRAEEFDFENINEGFDQLFEKRVAQDADVKDMDGTQPKKYYSGVDKSTKDDRARHFAKGAKMDDDNPAAYKPAPGDADAKTKESKHTKKYKEMFGEASEKDVQPRKRYHSLMNKNGTPKIDKRFKAFRSKKGLTEQFDNDEDLLKVVDEIWESVQLEEGKTESALKKKADKSGMPYGVLKKVYDRGVAAWRTGHRPGTTPAQWGMARVNSFVTKSSGTWGKADKDLASKVRSEEVELDEAADEQLSYDGKTTKNFDLCPGAVGAFKKNIEDRKDVDKAVKAVDVYLGMERQLLDKDDVTQQDYDKMKSAVDTAKKVISDAGLEGHEYHDMHLKRVEKKMKGVSEQIDIDSFFDLNESFDLMEMSIIDKAIAAIHKHVMGGTELSDIAFQVSRAAGVNMTGRELEKKYIQTHGKPSTDKKPNPEVTSRLKKRYGFKEEHGAGEEGTDKLAKKYKKDTPGQDINEAFDLIMEAECDLIGMDQIKAFEKFVDRMFEKFGIDFKFTRHFGERMSDGRNDPCIKLKELADFIKKIYANQGKSLKSVAGAEAVIKDIQTDLNIPVAVEYDAQNDEFDVVMKTVMRKKNFRTPNKVITYK